MATGSALVAAIAITLVVLLMTNRKQFKNKNLMLKVESVLMILVGIGIGGVIGATLAKVGAWLADVVAAITTKTVGVGAPAVLGIFLFGYVGIQLWKGHKANKKTPWFALMLAPVGVVLLPGTFGQFMTDAFMAINDGANDVVSGLFGGA